MLGTLEFRFSERGWPANRYAVQNPEVSVFRTALRITKVPKTGNVEFDLDVSGL